MGERRIEIDPDIRRAMGPPGDLFYDPTWYEQQRRRVFPRTWHLASAADGLDELGRVRPFVLLADCLDVPALLVRDSKGVLHGLSNVCTHRGNLIVEGEWTLSSLRCRYHGRRFHLDGTFAFMPDFEGCDGFPGDDDYLPRIPVAAWQGLVFAGLRPVVAADDVIRPVEARIGHLPLSDWKHDVEASRVFEVDVNWALVVQNLVDGFHLGCIHETARTRLRVDDLRTEVWRHGSVRIEPVVDRSRAFSLPVGHPDHGLQVGSYLFWLFPTTVLAVYPWGMLVIAVEPTAATRSRVRMLLLANDERPVDSDDIDDLERELREGAEVIRLVQRGVRSSLFRSGRYSPTQEIAVHHFHRLLAGWMAGGTGP